MRLLASILSFLGFLLLFPSATHAVSIIDGGYDPGQRSRQATCEFVDRNSYRQICLFAETTFVTEDNCEDICDNDAYTQCEWRTSNSSCTDDARYSQTRRDATLFSPSFGRFTVYTTAVNQQMKCVEQVSVQKPECRPILAATYLQNLGAQLGIVDPAAGGNAQEQECRALYEGCVLKGKETHNFNTPAQCTQILAAENHPDCIAQQGNPDDYQLCLNQAHAACVANCPQCQDSGAGDPVRGKPANYKGPIPDCAFTYSGCDNINDLLELMVNIAKFLFGIIGTIAFVFFIFGGVTIILSFGSADKVKKGKDILIAAIVGIAISFSAYMLISFLIQALGVSGEFDFRRVDAPIEEPISHV